MALTKWEFPWGPSLWGGQCFFPPDPSLGIGGAVGPLISSALYLAQDEPGFPISAGEVPYNIIGGDSIGWAPKNMGKFNESGNLTCVAITKTDSAIERHEFYFVRGDWAGRVARVTGEDTGSGVVHGEMFGHMNVTGLAGAPHPAFVFFSLDGSSNVQALNMPLSNSDTLNGPTIVWNNELGISSINDMRFVSLETHGTVIVTTGPSSQFPGQKAFFLKSTFGAGAAGPAVELNIDLRPSEQFSEDIGDFHVVETHNRVLLFYYTVRDELETASTAHFAYTPVHSTYTDELPFSTEGIIRAPRIIATGLKPIKAPKGARRHPATHDIIVGLEPSGTVRGDEIQWHLTRGYGNVLQGPPDVWNEETHPYLFGGRLKDAAPAREISILSVGWADPRQGGIFPITATLKLGDINETAVDFLNTYRTDSAENADQLRLCLGNLYTPNVPQDSNPAGSHQVVGGTSAPMVHNESERIGYHPFYDFLVATNILRLNDLQQTNLTVAEVGNNGVVTGGVTPTQGMVGGALQFYDPSASISIEGIPANDGENLAVSVWVFPEQSGESGPVTQFNIASRPNGEGGAWRLYWREDLQEFHFRVEVRNLTANVVLTTTTLGTLPEKHWYHLTGVFDHATSQARLYLNGFLVDDHTFVSAGELRYSLTETHPVILGQDLESSSLSFKGRVDDFVHGVDPNGYSQQQIVASFHYGLLGPNGPMRVSRSSVNPELQDKIIATAMHEAAQPGSGIYYTFALRKVAITPVAGIEHQIVIDIWRNNRSPGGGGPQFMGLIPPPFTALDFRAAHVAGSIRGHTIEHPFESYEIKVATTIFQTPEFLSVYFVLRGKNAMSEERVLVFRASCDPDYPVGQIVNDAAYDLVTQFDDGPTVTAMDVVLRGDVISDEAVVILAATDFATFPAGPASFQFVYIFREQDWGVGSAAIVNKRAGTSCLPEANTTGSFTGRNYATAYSTNDISGPIIRGLVAREIKPGMGIVTDIHTGIQVLFGLQSLGGGVFVPADAPGEQIVGTLLMTIGPSAIDSLSGGDFPLIGNSSRQMDEYEQGGIDPFIPMRIIPHPESVSGDVLVLGRSGNRAQDRGRDGNGGLAIYRVKSSMLFSYRICAMVGFDWGSSESVTIGASAALSTRSVEGEEPVLVHVSRLHPDRSDKFSTIYVSAEEALSGGWIPETLLSVTPVLRRNDRMSAVVWFDFKLTTRAFTDEPTGPKIVIGERYKYAINFKWSLPGSTKDLTP